MVVLVCGVCGKGQDVGSLVRVGRERGLAVVRIGQDASIIEQALAPSGVPVKHAATMADAVAAGFDLAQPGDTVLLSPACASMDMFKNYGARGHCFADEVQELALSRGEVA